MSIDDPILLTFSPLPFSSPSDKAFSCVEEYALLSAYEFLPSGRILPSVNPRRSVLEERSPLGIALLIFRSNAPLPNFLGKIAPALMAGNVVFAKPSPYTAVIFSKLLEFMREAGLDESVIQRIDGEADVATKVLELGVDLISFTGSTLAGTEILKMSSRTMPKVILECTHERALDYVTLEQLQS